MVIVKYHSKIKHRLLGGYLKVCVENVRSHRRRPFIVVDLYAGDGISVCKEPEESWEGSAQIIAKWVSKAGKNAYCILNEKEPSLIPCLEKNIEEYKEVVKKIYNDDANKIYKEILSKYVPKESHSIFFLDPYKHSDLKFSTVEGIAQHSIEDSYKGAAFVRRPELIINFPSYTMLMSIKQNEDLITEFIGTDKWKEELAKKPRRITKDMVLFMVYWKQLACYYGDGITYVKVKSLGANSPVYYLIFAATHPLAKKIHKRFKEWIEKNYDDFRKMGFELILKEEVKKKSIKTLDKFP